jgi:hypothetical protein
VQDTPPGPQHEGLAAVLRLLDFPEPILEPLLHRAGEPAHEGWQLGVEAVVLDQVNKEAIGDLRCRDSPSRVERE